MNSEVSPTPRTRIAETERLNRTAHHEAGHAVAAWRNNLRFKHVTIRPERKHGSLGHLLCCAHPKWFRPDVEFSDHIRLRAERDIITSLAGQIAEGRFLGKKPRYGMDADNRNAVAMAFRVGGSVETTEAYLKYCFSVARDLVTANWRSIEAVAAALVNRGILSRDDVIEIIMPGSASLRRPLEGNPGHTAKIGL